MAYVRQTWVDFPGTSTPITAARLRHIEDGIYDAGGVAAAIYSDIFVNARNGDAANDGITRDTPLATLAAALTQATDGMTIRVMDMDPDSPWDPVTITKSVRIVFEHNAAYINMQIRPSGDTDTMFTINANNVIIENLGIHVPDTFTGIGVYTQDAPSFQMDNYFYGGVEDADSNQTFGGTAIYLGDGERQSFRDVEIANATLGIYKGVEGSVGMFDNLNTHQNYQDCLFAVGGGGGWSFRSWKATNSGKPGDNTAVITFGTSNNSFVDVDWCESTVNRVVISGDDNTFLRPISSPACNWHIDGDRNRFYSGTILGNGWIVDGDDNTFQDFRSLGTFTGSGSRNTFKKIHGFASSTSLPTALTGEGNVFDDCSFSTDSGSALTLAGLGTAPRFVPNEATRTLAYSTTITTDVYTGSRFKITPTDGNAFTISNPIDSAHATTSTIMRTTQITYDIDNTSGTTLGTITWGNAFKLAGSFTNPANGKRRTISFYYDGSNWVETNRAAADI